MSLERYMFPFGSKAELHNDLDSTKKKLAWAKGALSVTKASNCQLRVQLHDQHEELMEIQYSRLNPIIQELGRMSDINVFTEPAMIPIRGETFGIQIRLPDYRIYDSDVDKYRYERHVINKCAHELAQKITDYVTEIMLRGGNFA